VNSDFRAKARKTVDATLGFATLVKQVFNDVLQRPVDSESDVLQSSGVQPAKFVGGPTRKLEIARGMHRHATALERLQDVSGH